MILKTFLYYKTLTIIQLFNIVLRYVVTSQNKLIYALKICCFITRRYQLVCLRRYNTCYEWKDILYILFSVHHWMSLVFLISIKTVIPTWIELFCKDIFSPLLRPNFYYSFVKYFTSSRFKILSAHVTTYTSLWLNFSTKFWTRFPHLMFLVLYFSEMLNQDFNCGCEF